MKIGMEGDWRHISNGLEIPTQSYSDQPYIVRTGDGAWLCCVTTGPGHEGVRGQHVTTMRSTDQGHTWSAPVPVEPPDSPENSYAVMLKTPSGRIYIFYNHNSDNVRKVKCHDGQNEFDRVDSLGHFVFKYSDDHGKSWSEKRYDIPFRLFKCDRENAYGGEICFFWNVGRPFVHGGAAFVSLHKVGQMGKGFFQQSEGALLKSDNILTETEPEKIRWETLPDGEIGLRSPPGGGLVSEEQSYCVLSDGSIHCVYRSIDGYPVESYSRDGGHTWSMPRYKCFADGRRIKHPRAANFAWKCGNGKYLYWFHNHGGSILSAQPGNADGGAYDDRNPVWLCGGVETDSPEGRIIKWSEPEIVLYDDDPFVRISYPDLIEEDGRYFLSETQKDTARIHEIPADFLERIWKGLEARPGGRKTLADFADAKPILDMKGSGSAIAPKLPEFFTRDFQSPDFRGRSTGNGFAIEIILSLGAIRGCSIIEGRRKDGRGLELNIAADGSLELIMDDGWMEQRMTSEPCLKADGLQHVVINVDGGPRIVSFIVNGRFCDGGEQRQFGWQRFSPYLRHVNWCEKWTISNVKHLKVHDRVLMAAESKMT
ncbi:MAG: sialidase family protein [Victivallales bacterium]